MFSCREVSRIIASDRLDSVGRWRRMAIRMHLLLCRYCRSYVEQLRAISAAAREAWSGLPTDPSVLRAMEERILVGRFGLKPPEPPADSWRGGG